MTVQRWMLGVAAVAALLLGMQAATASAETRGICSQTIPPNSRCVYGARLWIYGVGFRMDSIYGWDNQNICVGAKTNSDGTGGNALPFRCEVISRGQTIWTAGGNSNWGHGTIINNNAQGQYGQSGLMNADF
jgi:hypothetical protein